MYLSDLFITQEELRNPSQLKGMIAHLECGKLFDKKSINKYTELECNNLIEIVCINIGRRQTYYIHNGHHRCVAIYLAGRTYLDRSEYFIKIRYASEYKDVNFAVGYVTPFDIVNEIRIGDIGKYKERVLCMYKEMSTLVALDYVYNHPKEYRRKRQLYKLEELANKYMKEHTYQ